MRNNTERGVAGKVAGIETEAYMVREVWFGVVECGNEV